MNRDQYDFVVERLGGYFQIVRKELGSSKATLVAIEILLQNPHISNKFSFMSLRQCEASYADTLLTDMLRGYYETNDNLWKIEGQLMKRWDPTRKSPMSVGEVYWLSFLHYYTESSAGLQTITNDVLPLHVIAHPSGYFHDANPNVTCDPVYVRNTCMKVLTEVLERFKLFF
jgi:hypothetical protein